MKVIALFLALSAIVILYALLLQFLFSIGPIVGFVCTFSIVLLTAIQLQDL
jgi:hypothetical protein